MRGDGSFYIYFLLLLLLVICPWYISIWIFTVLCDKRNEYLCYNIPLRMCENVQMHTEVCKGKIIQDSEQ